MNWTDFFNTTLSLTATYGLRVVVALALFFVGKFVARKGIDWVSRLMVQRGVDATVCGFVAKIAYVLALVLLAVAAVSQVGIPTTSFIAAIGAAGLAIGLALQGSLSNFASGVLLVTLKPCETGDYIESGAYSGTVEDISLFSTILRCGDGRSIIIPNSTLFSSAITNYSTSPVRRIDLVFGVAYDADIDKAKQVLTDVVKAEKRVHQDKPLQLGVQSFEHSSVSIVVKPWVNTEDYVATRFALYESVKSAFDTAGIALPYQRFDVKVVEGQARL